MANLFSLHSVGNSLVTFLRNTYPDVLRTEIPCEFRLVSGEELDAEGNPFGETNTVSLFLYRVTRNEHLRNETRINASSDGPIPLAIDLHYLLTVWAAKVLHEHTMLTWAMRQLYEHPTLNPSSLTQEADWHADDIVRITPTELSNEDMMRIWDALKPAYRLSVTYRASVVRVDAEDGEEYRPVVASRFSYGRRGG